MDASLLQARVEMLIGQLEEEVRKLSSFHEQELEHMRQANAVDMLNLSENFEKRLSLVNSTYESRIADLQGEIEYLKELNLAQRLMMEDNAEYIKVLEEKLESLRSLS